MTVLARAVCIIALTQLDVPSSLAVERSLEDEPAPSKVEDMEAPLERSYPDPVDRPSLFPWVREGAKGLTPFLADSQLYVRYRTY
jgi:hypothetical protein